MGKNGSQNPKNLPKGKNEEDEGVIEISRKIITKTKEKMIKIQKIEKECGTLMNQETAKDKKEIKQGEITERIELKELKKLTEITGMTEIQNK